MDLDFVNGCHDCTETVTGGWRRRPFRDCAANYCRHYAVQWDTEMGRRERN